MFLRRLIYRASNLKQSLIDTSFTHVNTYGWNQRAIAAACLDLDISPASQKYQLISWAMNKWDKQTIKKLDDYNFDGVKGIKNKVALAIKTRLQHEIPFIDRWNQAMAVGAKPENFVETQKRLWNFADEIWVRCGDKSTDYNYYSKRFLFQSVYVSTQLFMLTDKSKDFQATWQFMDRRLNDILSIGKSVGSTISTLGVMFEGLVTSARGVLLSYPDRVDDPIQAYKSKQNSHQNFNNNADK